MNLAEFAFLADESFDPEVAVALRAEGWNIVTAREAALLGTPDVLVMRAAFAEQRAILTHDADFGSLAVSAHEPLVGVVHIRPGHIASEFTLATIRAIVAAKLDIRSPFVLVARRRAEDVVIRLRQL